MTYTYKSVRAAMLGTAIISVFSQVAVAQNESVTVTGTTIRGQQPVGANVISVDRAAIEATGAQTTAQLLVTIPQLDNFGAAAQGGQNSSDSTVQAPTIYNLGNSASNSTLILVDGHRMPLTGLSHNLVDPSIIPTSAIASVEVLPDGASAIYGSDAVAGVINFHTRKDYSGWETSVQAGIADHYSSYNFAQLFGHSWENGGMTAIYNYSSRSNLMNRDRDFITARQDLRRGAADPSLFVGVPAASSYAGLQTVAPNGQAVPYPSDGGNFQNLTSCPVATISTATSNSTPVYAYPYAGTTSIPRQTTPSGGPSTGICDTSDIASDLPSETRQQGMLSLYQALTDKLTLNADVVYSSRQDSARSARGGVTNAKIFNPAGTGDTAFGAASSVAAMQHTNPFYVGVPGAAANTNAEFVSLDFSELLAGQGLGYASVKTGQTTAFATIGLDYDVGGDWLFSVGGTAGTDYSFRNDTGSLNSGEALLALNGTTNTNGTAATTPAASVISDVYGLDTVVSVTRALTTANALDVWMPAATNRTSASVLRSLVDSARSENSVQGFQNLTLHADGPLFDLFGAGDVKAAFGAEYIHYTQDQRQFTPSNVGPNSTSSRALNLTLMRTVYAAYAEFVVPVISPDMNIPLVRNLVFDFAGRYDQYNDFGETENPKIAVSWDLIDGIRTSASFGTSFTAPALNSVGRASDGLLSTASVAGSNTGASNGLVVLFNDTRPFNNNAGIAGTFVSNAVACAAAGSQPVEDADGNINAVPGGTGLYPTAIGCKNVVSGGTGSQGLAVYSGNRGLRPELGQTYSANLVFDNFGKFWGVLEGLSTQITYYQAKFTGAITNGGINTSQTAKGLPWLTTFAPANCTGPLTCNPGWDPTDPVVQSVVLRAPLTTPLPTRIYSIRDFSQQNAFNLWDNGIDFAINYRMSTDDYGNFTFGLNGNQILRGSQQNGPFDVVFDTKDGRNGGRFTNIEFTGRASVSWRMDPFTVGLSFNYQHPYNVGNNTFPFNYPGPGRLAGIQHIGAQQTVDVNFSYNLPDDWMSGTVLNVSISNLFDTLPPYRDNATGTNGGSDIGRTINLGIRKKW